MSAQQQQGDDANPILQSLGNLGNVFANAMSQSSTQVMGIFMSDQQPGNATASAPPQPMNPIQAEGLERLFKDQNLAHKPAGEGHGKAERSLVPPTSSHHSSQEGSRYLGDDTALPRRDSNAGELASRSGSPGHRSVNKAASVGRTSSVGSNVSWTCVCVCWVVCVCVFWVACVCWVVCV
jgi:hypothetical protein